MFSKGLVRGFKSKPPPGKKGWGVSGQWLHSGQYQGDASSYSSAVVFAVAAASVQGATIEGRVAIHDLDNPHMQNKSVLEMATGRAVHSQNLCFLEKDARSTTIT